MAKARAVSPSPGERMKELVKYALQVMATIEKKEESLAQSKALLDKLQRTDLPELLKELKLTDATLADIGQKVTLSSGIEASIPEGSRADAFLWLAKNGAGAIVRAEVSVLFGASELKKAQKCASILKKQKYTPEVSMSVPPPTLKAWAREMIQQGKDIPPTLFNVRSYDIARINPIKAKKVTQK